MSRCTAPVHGHRTASGRDNCPACRGGGYRTYGRYATYPSYTPKLSSSRGGSSSSGQKVKASWSSPGSTILYSPAELEHLLPFEKML